MGRSGADYNGAYSPIRSLGARMRDAAARAAARNSVLLGRMSSPPAVTVSASNPNSGLTNGYPVYPNNAGKYRVVGGTAESYGTNYVTAYSVTMPSGSGGNTAGDAAHTTYNYAVEFMSDAPQINVQVLHTGTPYQIEINDQPVFADPGTVVPGTGGAVYIYLNGLPAGVNKIRVECTLGAAFYAANVAPGYSIWPPQPVTGIRTASVGDSIDSSTGSRNPNGTWNQIAAKLLGWSDHRQVSFGGTGFCNPGSENTFGDPKRVQDVVNANPDLLIISGSQNDDSYTAAQITSAALSCFQAYRAALPNVPIVVVGVDAGSSGPSTARTNNDTAVNAAFTQWADPNSYWIPNCQDPAGSWQTGTGQDAPFGPPGSLVVYQTAASGGTFTAGTYYWVVTATDANGETVASPETSVAVAANGTASLLWSYPPGNATGYKVYRGTATGAENVLVATLSGGSTQAYTDTGAAGTAATPPGTNTTGHTVGDGNRDRYAFDSAHPNQAGHTYLAQRFANGFRSAVLPNIP